MSNSPKTCILDIQRLAAGGDAIARHEGKAVFVAGGCPGDRLQARIVQEGKRFDRAEIDEILTPGPSRVTPPCPVFGECGGCQWQHIAYDCQIREKAAILEENLRRLGGVDAGPPQIEAGEAYGYRVRARFVRDHRGVFGFRRARGHEAVDVSACLVMHPDLRARACQVAEVLREAGYVGEVDLGLSPDTGAAAIWLHELVSEGQARGILDACVDLSGLVTGSGDRRRCFGLTELPLSGGAHRDAIPHPIDAFWQANDSLNRRVLERIAELVTTVPGEGAALELFSGSGNLTRVLTGSGRRVLAVEQNPVACERLGRWAKEKNWNLTLWCEAASRGLVRARTEETRPDIVVLDPPRAGLGDATTELARLGAGKIVYLSCDTATLARDCRVLVEAGYRASQVTLLDFFPQTHHIETLVVLER